VWTTAKYLVQIEMKSAAHVRGWNYSAAKKVMCRENLKEIHPLPWVGFRLFVQSLEEACFRAAGAGS
jgi:hypothetical protein